MKNEVEKLLQKQMDRKGFIRHVAIGFAAIAGITTIAKTLNTMSSSGQSQSVGYGSNTYGGTAKKRKVRVLKRNSF
jgi:hypothetical protein